MQCTQTVIDSLTFPARIGAGHERNSGNSTRPLFKSKAVSVIFNGDSLLSNLITTVKKAAVPSFLCFK